MPISANLRFFCDTPLTTLALRFKGLTSRPGEERPLPAVWYELDELDERDDPDLASLLRETFIPPNFSHRSQ